MNKIYKIILFIILIFSLKSSDTLCDNFYARSIFIPRQLSYNPILENAQVLSIKNNWKINSESKIKITKTPNNNLNSKLNSEKDNINIEQYITTKNIKIDPERQDKDFLEAEKLLSKIIYPFSHNNKKASKQESKQSQFIILSPKEYIDKKEKKLNNKLINKNFEQLSQTKQLKDTEPLENTELKPDIEKIIEPEPILEPEIKENATLIQNTKLQTNTEKITPQDPIINIEQTPEPEIKEIIKKQETTINQEKHQEIRTYKELDYVFSLKPIYTQNVGSKLQKYFNIYHKCSLDIKENGYGDINPLWFNSTQLNDISYSSNLSFCPKRQTYGSLAYFAAQLPHNLEININTAIIYAQNNINICEINIQNNSTSENKIITKSFSSYDRNFGKICGSQTKIGLDDIQVKLIYAPKSKELLSKNSEDIKYLAWDIYGLLGIPTGIGSQAKYLFEPIIGSKHAQVGFGANLLCDIIKNNNNSWSILSEFKYRYAFVAEERRSFDLKYNCQWSRYMLFINELNKYLTYPAINDLTFNVKVKPNNSIDLYIATHIDHNKFNLELGYDLWYRSPEKIKLCCKKFPNVSIADLKGIKAKNPQSAYSANISQSVTASKNQIVSDKKFTPITINDISCISGAMESSLSNSFYASIGYKLETKYDNSVLLGLNASYERGSYIDSPDNVTTWLNCDFYF